MLIAHATDLTGDDDAAFVHATALAVNAGARLVTVHANPGRATANQLPDATALAARWNRTVEHERICHDCCDEVADTVLDALQRLHADLVVVGTHARHGFAALAHESIGEAIARNLHTPVLVVPNTAHGFVNPLTGSLDLSRILIAAGSGSDAQRSLDAARALLAFAPDQNAQLELVRIEEGNPEQGILARARERGASLIAMATRAHDSIADVFLGSHTERVIRQSACPVVVLY